MASRILRDYKCQEHGFFEGFQPKCPEGCEGELILQVFLKSPGFVSAKTKATDKNIAGLAKDFGMSNIKSTREGEHQEGYLSRNNKFSEQAYAEAEKYATKKVPRKRKGKAAIDSPKPPEPRPGDAAIWGGGDGKGMFSNFDLKTVLSGQFSKPIKDESVGLTPRAAGINNGPTADPSSTLHDPDKLQIKT